MIVNRSSPNGTIVPSLIYHDVGKAIEWLCRVFGFTERLRVADQSGKVGHAQLAIGEGGVILGAARTGQGFAAADSAEFRPPRPSEVSQTLSVHVQNVDRHYERAKQSGARILQPPQTHPYGERQYTAEDLDGYRWTFSQSVEDAAPEAWGAVVGKIQTRLALLPRPRFCYLEIPARNLQESILFYEKVFGWSIRGRDTGRPSFDDATGNVSGAWVRDGVPASQESGKAPGLLPYIWVDAIDSAVRAVAASGGEIVNPPHLDSPDGQWIATFRDPAGNTLGLYQEGRREGD